MRPSFQADADFNKKIIAGLRRREPAIRFRTAVEGKVVGRPDPEVLAIAAREDRILVSHDRRTMPAHFAHFIQHQASPGLIIVEQDFAIGAAIEQLLLIWAASDHSDWEDTIGYIPMWHQTVN
jgi:hypothetical protein